MQQSIVIKLLLGTALVLTLGFTSMTRGANQHVQADEAARQLVARAIRASVLAEQQGDYVQAWQHAQKALEANGRSYAVYIRLAYLSWVTGDLSSAAAFYGHSTRIEPHSISAQLGLLRVFNAQGEYQQAEQQGHRILQVDLYNYHGNLGLAYALRQQGKYSLAAEVSEKMRRIYPDDVDVLLSLALVHFYAENYSKALALFEQVEQYAPNHATVIYYRNLAFSMPVINGSSVVR